MSGNPNYFGNNRFTFQSQYNLAPVHPPLPQPPCFSVPPPMAQPRPPTAQTSQIQTPVASDQEFLKRFEKPAPSNKNNCYLTAKMSISEVKDKLRNIVLTLNSLKHKEKYLQENLSALSEENWSTAVKEIEQLKSEINEKISTINDTYLNIFGKFLAKRTAKRLRLKRVAKERQREQIQIIKEMKERSRKIDENLQKIKDDINKSKQEEESKLRADIMLKETLRKKNDAKKCLVKLDALMKLRRARQNTAKGRGENVSESDATSFNSNIEKLKSLWAQKLISYEQEEMEIRAKLQVSTQSVTGATERETTENLSKWRHFLFGTDVTPQVDFRGDVAVFVKVRCQWDQYISEDGSPIPIGWATPH